MGPMNLSLLILLPLLTAIAILLVRNATQVKRVALSGATLQFVLAFVLDCRTDGGVSLPVQGSLHRRAKSRLFASRGISPVQRARERPGPA